MTCRFIPVLAMAAMAGIASSGAHAASADGEAQFRALYKELVETNTTLSVGSCTLAAERIAARMKAAGYADAELHPFADAAHPTDGGFNGAKWLTENRRDLIDAGFAINEGAGGEFDAAGKRVTMTVQAGEKVSQNYQLEVSNRGGHSSRPQKDNAIYHLAGALTKIESYAFPVQLADGSRGYLNGMADIQAAQGHADVAAAMRAIVANPQDSAAVALVSSRDAGWAAMLRTTCVATMLDAGHATNALPQRARANINCRIFPGVTQETVRLALERAVADPAVKVETLEIRGGSSPPPPLTKTVLGPVQQLTAQFWPGVPVLPLLQSGATDGQFLNAAGIPTYGISGIFLGPDLGNIHGLNEYIGVESLLQGRDFLYRLVKLYAEQP